MQAGSFGPPLAIAPDGPDGTSRDLWHPAGATWPAYLADHAIVLCKIRHAALQQASLPAAGGHLHLGQTTKELDLPARLPPAGDADPRGEDHLNPVSRHPEVCRLLQV